jgi:GntR family transcriptional repressor for pyruvate dehydrogenase complex
MVHPVPDRSPPPFGRRAETVYRALLTGIEEGRYEVHGKLPTEHELAETFGVSRPVVRNALAQLRQEGLVRSVQGSGTVVVFNPKGPAISETAATDAQGGSVRDLQRCFEFRVLVEGEAAHAAALRHNPRSLERLSESLYAGRHVAAPQNADQAYRTFDFHRAVVDASDNPFLQQSLDLIVASSGFRVYLSHVRLDTNAVNRLAMVNAEHIEIFRLIERRQAAEAREAMRGHIQRAYDMFMERIPLRRNDQD